MLDISSISSYATRSILRAVEQMLGSVVYTPSTSVKMWHSAEPRAAARATAEVSEPPRLSVVMRPSSVQP